MPQNFSQMDQEMWRLARRMNQLMDKWMHAPFPGDPKEAWQPAVDICECEDCYYITAELAGMSRETIGVRVAGNVLTLSGQRTLGRHDRQTEVHQMELSRGPFRRTIQLPIRLDDKDIEVDYRRGLLEIRVPKRTGRCP